MRDGAVSEVDKEHCMQLRCRTHLRIMSSCSRKYELPVEFMQSRGCSAHFKCKDARAAEHTSEIKLVYR